MNQEECICALATPAGGAIGIIRLSGNNAITITDQVFTSASGKPLTGAKANTLHYGMERSKIRTEKPSTTCSLAYSGHPTVTREKTPRRFPVTAADTFFNRFYYGSQKWAVDRLSQANTPVVPI